MGGHGIITSSLTELITEKLVNKRLENKTKVTMSFGNKIILCKIFTRSFNWKNLFFKYTKKNCSEFESKYNDLTFVNYVRVEKRRRSSDMS